MLFPIKNEQEMLNEMMVELESKTGINDFSPGSIARSLLEVFNRKLHSAYRYFDIYAGMMFLSTSEGQYLDLMGKMLNCSRIPGESDENYRYRISNQVFSAASANETAIRLKCLSVAGVKDVVITKYVRGSGSFSIHVLTDELDTPDSVLVAVQSVVNEVKSEGIKAIVSKPRVVPIDITFSCTTKNKSAASVNSIAGQIKTSLQGYIDSLSPMGAEISILKVTSLAGLSEHIDELFLSGFQIRGQQVVIRDKFALDWDERSFIRTVKLEILG